MPEIDTRFPWIAQQRWHQSDGVSRDLQTGYQLGQRNRDMELRQEYQASQLRSLQAYRETQINSLLMRQKQMEAEQTDAAKVTEWMRDPRQPPPEGIQTPKGMKAVADVQRVFLQNERNGLFGAVQKGYNDQIKGLDAMGILKVQSALKQSEGEITPEIATMIDTETARVKGSMVKARILNESGELYVKGGEGKPAFIQSLETGGIQRLPQDWNGEAEPLTDVEGNVLGYGIRTGSGNIRLLPQRKPTEPTLSAPQKAAMNSEFKTINQWWADLESGKRSKKENQDELQRRLQAVQDKYSPSPAAPSPNSPARMRVRSPDGKIGTIPENQLQDALKQGYSTVE